MRIDEVILHFLEGENEGVEIKLTPPRELYIGRSEESDIFLGEKKISRKHSMITVSEDGISISDLESTNGTFVNSKKISEMELKNGDKIKVGSSVIEVQIQSKGAASADAPTGSKAKEKSTPKIPPKKEPVKEKSTPKAPPPKEVEEESDELLEIDQKDDPEGTAYVKELDDLGGDEPSEPKAKPRKKSLEEEDSDLVVEYQTSIKEVKKVKENETSEKLQGIHSKEEDELDDFGDLSLDAPEEEPEDQAMGAPILVVEDDEASFDKIPDLEIIEEDANADIAIEEEDLAPKSAKPLMGDLSSMGLSDLLQNLHQNKKTGVLTLSNVSTSGKILISEGALLSAESGKSKGMKAMYRMLTWKNGDFEFQPMSPGSDELQSDQESIQDSVETILMEGFRQYDELRKIQKILPQMEDELALEEQLEVPISKLHPKVLDVVQLIINHKKMKNVLDLSSLSDLETSKIVFYLIKKKVIKIKK